MSYKLLSPAFSAFSCMSNMVSKPFFPHAVAIFVLLLIFEKAVSIDYGLALTKSLLYYEAQRSGKLPSDQRVQWRGDSALNDGKDAGVDLVGGYYDAGDNVKFGLPMAFTVTMLAWSVVDFKAKIEAKKELSNALKAIKWGTDYFIKAHPQPNVLYGQVGDGDSDHQCWQRPEDMTTPRKASKIDEQHPGADLAGETAAALAAAALAFNKTDPTYSSQLITHAKQLFNFSLRSPRVYQDSIQGAGNFYPSSGYEDEQIWAAAWLYRATEEEKYADFVSEAKTNKGGVRTTFSWDDKNAGAQTLLAKIVLEGKLSEHKSKLEEYQKNAEEFICNCIQKGKKNVARTRGGLLWFMQWNNLQYTTASLFIISTYATTLSSSSRLLQCPQGPPARPQELMAFVQSQVDYILGANPRNMSYMVGFGSNYPKRVHHRGASIVSIKINSTAVKCGEGFSEWFNRDSPNPNVIDGAIVGGPDLTDDYSDSRSNYQQAEPATANTAPLVGVLSSLT